MPNGKQDETESVGQDRRLIERARQQVAAVGPADSQFGRPERVGPYRILEQLG